MTRHQAAIRLAHILSIGVLDAEALILMAERTSTGQHAWRDAEDSDESTRAYQREIGR